MRVEKYDNFNIQFTERCTRSRMIYFLQSRDIMDDSGYSIIYQI